jgi:acetyl-CoA carboxylase carboxyltransferase component
MNVTDQRAAAPDELPASLRAVIAERARGRDEDRAAAVRKQHAAGKLTVRERVARLADAHSFVESGGMVKAVSTEGDDDLPGDGVVAGVARIEGRPVAISANDFTVMGGSTGKAGREKTARMLQFAIDQGTPYVMLADGGGHRIQEGLDSRRFASVETTFQELVNLSGWAPIVAAMMGPGFAGPSNAAALADFTVMVRKTSTMGIAGPALVKAATGEDIDKESLGGADVQADRHGIADLAVDSDEEALAAIRRYLSYFPSNAGAPPPIVRSDDPVDRRDPELLTVVPENSRRAYDVHRVITGVVDRDSVFELKPAYARNVVTCLARLGGRPVGVIANQPLHLAGTLDAPACEKVAHFISVCDAFGLPLVFFIDIPGFLVGMPAERSGLAKRSARIVHELGRATVPRLSVVLRKGYGLGFIAMNGGRTFGADLTVAWPTAEICAMSIEGAVDVAFRKEVEGATDPAAHRAGLVAEFRGRISPIAAAQGFGVDDVIDPRDTRPLLIETLGRLAPRRHTSGRPPKFHDISPI